MSKLKREVRNSAKLVLNSKQRIIEPFYQDYEFDAVISAPPNQKVTPELKSAIYDNPIFAWEKNYIICTASDNMELREMIREIAEEKGHPVTYDNVDFYRCPEVLSR